jgi:hypothetical protein
MIKRTYKQPQVIQPTPTLTIPPQPAPTEAAPEGMPASVAAVVSEELAKPTPSAENNAGTGDLALRPQAEALTAAEAGRPTIVGSFIVTMEDDSHLNIKPREGDAGPAPLTAKAVEVRMENKANGKTILVIIADVTKVDPVLQDSDKPVDAQADAATETGEASDQLLEENRDVTSDE